VENRYAAEAATLQEYNIHQRLYSRTICVTRRRNAGHCRRADSRQQVARRHGRVKRDDDTRLIQGSTHLEISDQITAISTPQELDRVTEFLGEAGDQHIEFDRSAIDYRRIFVSNPKLAGRRIRDLHCSNTLGPSSRASARRRRIAAHGRHGHRIGRPRPRPHPAEHMDEVTAFFAIRTARCPRLTFSLQPRSGAGLIVGSLPIPLPAASRSTR